MTGSAPVAGRPPRSAIPTGIGVDASGGPVVDPSVNVAALSEASNRRQDDLRVASERLVETRLDDLARIDHLRAEHDRELRQAESRRVDQMLELRASYEERLALAEAKRIDAIRAVDVNAVSVASQRASDQATVLATQVAQSAEALRALVASTANTVAQSQQQLATTLSTRITTLEQAQYEGKGKAGVSDPAFALLLAEVKSLRETGSTRTGSDTGQATQAANTRAMIATIVGVGALLLSVIVYLSREQQAVAVPAERVVIEGAQQ